MKRFIKKLFIFLIPVIIFIALWEYGLSTIPNSYSLKRAQLEAQAPKIEVLVLGPSHALMGVNPDYFSMKGYNAANIQQSLFYDTRIALKYLDKMTSLKVVLIDISYSSLWFQLFDIHKGVKDYFYAEYWGIRYPEIKSYDIRIYSKILQYGNFRAWNYALMGFKVNLALGYNTNGWGTRVGESLINDSTGYAQMKLYDKECDADFFNNNMNDLGNLLRELNRRKIHPVFFTPPFTQSLCKYMDKGRLKSISDALFELCAKYNCKWFNYQNDARFSDKDFRDVSHLNQDGAAKFSKIINNEILKQYDTLAGK